MGKNGVCALPPAPLGQRSWGVLILRDYAGPNKTAARVLLNSAVTASPTTSGFLESLFGGSSRGAQLLEYP